MTRPAFILLTIGALCAASVAPAHHTYALYDGTVLRAVEGTVAKVEWRNPHVFLWVYVADRAAPSGYALYAFENGSIPVLERLGWTKESFEVGERVRISYWPLKDGRRGGHLHQGRHANGTVIEGAGGPPNRVTVVTP